MKKKIHKSIAFILLITLILCPSISCFADVVTDDYYAQYSGSTTASWGYEPY